MQPPYSYLCASMYAYHLASCRPLVGCQRFLL